MGSTISLCCKDCCYKKDFTVGVGMMYSPDNIRDLDGEFAMLPDLIPSKRTLTYIKELLEERNAEITDDYGHGVYRCKKCGEFHGRFYLRLEFDGGSYDVEYKCPRCKTKMERVDCLLEPGDCKDSKVNLENYPCPACGKHSLYEGESMLLWD